MAKTVKIPQGLYLVGRDIPVGTYSIRMSDEEDVTVVHYYIDVDDSWTYDRYWLEQKHPDCRIGVEKGNRLQFNSPVIMERIVDTMISFD